MIVAVDQFLMLSSLQILVLASVQGLTEFLPVSSSAHLILVPKLFGWLDQGLRFDVAVHFGTLLAVLIYFRRELIKIANDIVLRLCGREATPYSNLGFQLIIATLPVCLIGFLFHDAIEDFLRSPLLIGIFTIIFACVLWWSDKKNSPQKPLADMTSNNALKIGLYQILSLIPGVSRSGITLTAGLQLGFARDEASRFSFLLSIPVIIAAVSLEGYTLLKADSPINYEPLLWGMAISGLCAYACIHTFLKVVNRWGMLPFVLYRFALGSILLVYFLV